MKVVSYEKITVEEEGLALEILIPVAVCSAALLITIITVGNVLLM